MEYWRLSSTVLSFRAGDSAARALGSAQMEEGKSPSLVELNASN
jgi:hypothetical protein